MPGIRVRVGDELSPVNPGDPIPATGGHYHAGMYAPSIDELATLTFSEANEAGLLPSTLPIYDPAGSVDEKKVEEWDPNRHLSDFGMSMNNKIPKYSAAIIGVALDEIGDLAKNIGLKHIYNGEKDHEALMGELIIAAKVDQSSRKFNGGLIVYPGFYKYISTPIIPKVPGRTSGISVAAYAVYHSIGHLMFSRLHFDGKLNIIGDFIEKSGWSKYADIGAYHGSYMHIKNNSVWRRDTRHRFESELSKYSPADDFSEIFALNFTHHEYLASSFPKKHSILIKALEEYGV